MRIGLYGGTFDPVHTGHLILAERCREAARLDQVWWLPSYIPPHKQSRRVSRFEYRCEMIALALMGQPQFRVEPIEKELPPPSYSLNTVRELAARHPVHQFSLIVGADCLPDLPQWHEPAALLREVELIVVPRPGVPMMTQPALSEVLGMNSTEIRMTVVDCPLMDFSSSEIRSRVQVGQTIRFLVPRSVEEYVRERKLYSAAADSLERSGPVSE